jgi:hypothetical protein
MPTLNSVGHLVIGALAIAGVVVLAALHDVSGTSAIEVILAAAGLATTASAASNSSSSS